MTINKDTPIAMLTVGQLQHFLNKSNQQESKPGASTDQNAKPKRYVYGIAGIRELFGVSHVTAQRYKDGIIRDAVSQQGRVIVTDAEKAMQLFKEHGNKKGGAR